jgi:hypothetical protein
MVGISFVVFLELTGAGRKSGRAELGLGRGRGVASE